MKKCRLYIADMDLQFIAGIRRAVAGCQGIEIIGSSGNGRTALRDCLRLKPDVVISDIPLPEFDGISLLHELQRLSQVPSVIVCTYFYSDATMQCACRYGASIFLCKPIEMATLPVLIQACGHSSSQSLTDIERHDRQSDAQRLRGAAVHKLLKDLGMSVRLDGATYFIEAAVHCNGDALLMKNLSKGLYAQLAQRMDTTVSRIERSMRSAIAIAYDRGSLSRCFEHRPSNREFIEYLMNAVDHNERSSDP